MSSSIFLLKIESEIDATLNDLFRTLINLHCDHLYYQNNLEVENRYLLWRLKIKSVI